MLCLSARTLSDADIEKDHFNTVPKQHEGPHASGRKSNQFVRDGEDSQAIFRACSQYLERRGGSDLMHKEIEEHERFIHHLRTYSTGAADPPIVLRGGTGEQELQVALY